MKNKVKIYTFAHNRPDLLPIQLETFKKYIKDDFEFIVFNNEKPGSHGGYNPLRKEEIFKVCEYLGIECIDVRLDDEFRIINNELQYTPDGAYINGSTACSYPCTWIWKNYICKDQGLSVIIDTDMFLCKEVSFIEMMEGYNFAYVPSYRDNCKIKYTWNNLIFVKPQEIPNPEEMSWGYGYINGTAVDVGGEVYYYLQKYEDQLKTLYIDQWGLLVDTKAPYELSLNGCAQYWADFEKLELAAGESQALLPPAPKTFPHQTDREDYWDYFYQNWVKLLKIVEGYGFPKPTFIDYIKLEKDDSIEDSFIFHYKAASNYMPWATEEYNQEKTTAFRKLLGI